MTRTDAQLDHIVIASGDLADLISTFERVTGVRPTPGGRHDVGTVNALVPLTGEGTARRTYLEFIGPGPDGPEALTRDSFGLVHDGRPRIAGYAVRTPDLDETARRLRVAGRRPEDPQLQSRRRPDGSLLTWRLVPPQTGESVDCFPFVIDWMDSAHPADAPSQVHLVGLTVTLPSPGPLTRAVALAAPVAVERGPVPSLSIALETPRGRVTGTDLGLLGA